VLSVLFKNTYGILMVDLNSDFFLIKKEKKKKKRRRSKIRNILKIKCQLYKMRGQINTLAMH